MKNMLVSLGFFLFLSSFIYAQSGQYEVYAIAGNVKTMQSNEFLKKGDVVYLEFKDNKVTNLVFSSDKDVVYFKNISTKKVLPIYAKTPAINKNGLITRGSSYVSDNRSLINYFSDTVFIIDADTLFLSGTSFRTDEKTLAVLQYSANGTETKDFLRMVGKNDTLILSHQTVFGSMPLEERYIASFLVDSMELKQYITGNATEKKKIVEFPDIKPFKIIFLDDVIRYNAALGLSDVAIYNLLLSSYISLQTILTEYPNLSSGEEAEEWLKKRIESVNSN